jgi:hypothetical protein
MNRSRAHLARTTAVKVAVRLSSIVAWGTMFGFLGSASDQPLLGAVLGSGIGGVLGIGFIYGRIGWFVVGVSLFSLLGAIVCPGCDAPALLSALIGAASGAFIGTLGLPGMSMAIVAILGGILGVAVAYNEMGFWIGFLAGGISGYRLGAAANRAIHGRALRAAESRVR